MARSADAPERPACNRSEAPRGLSASLLQPKDAHAPDGLALAAQAVGEDVVSRAALAHADAEAGECVVVVDFLATLGRREVADADVGEAQIYLHIISAKGREASISDAQRCARLSTKRQWDQRLKCRYVMT